MASTTVRSAARPSTLQPTERPPERPTTRRTSLRLVSDQTYRVLTGNRLTTTKLRPRRRASGRSAAVATTKASTNDVRTTATHQLAANEPHHVMRRYRTDARTNSPMMYSRERGSGNSTPVKNDNGLGTPANTPRVFVLLSILPTVRNALESDHPSMQLVCWPSRRK
jgi:hypothetical protein